ncbi:MAG: transposase [Planctomycetaceae bacterium]|nr:transposase [Planctomycetaceae bacterium]
MSDVGNRVGRPNGSSRKTRIHKKLDRLISISAPTIALSDFMKELKEYSSKWLARNPNFPDFESWAVSFAGFTYNLNDKQTIINYIKNQNEYHKTVSFEEEYRQFLIDNSIEIDERYFLKE